MAMLLGVEAGAVAVAGAGAGAGAGVAFFRPDRKMLTEFSDDVRVIIGSSGLKEGGGKFCVDGLFAALRLASIEAKLAMSFG
tara:strand:- start:741 stop:986 length:246 start_codon:yes stop_codon:yes gene_type:complete